MIKIIQASGADGKFFQDKENKMELRLGVTVDNQVTLITFGKSVTWIGLTPSNARMLANLLIEKAKEIEAKHIPVTLAETDLTEW